MKLLTVTSGPTWPGNAPLPDVGTGVGTVIFRPVSRVASGTGTTIGESIARLVVTAQGTIELRGTDYVPFQLWGGVPADGAVEAPVYEVEEYLHLYVGTPQERAAVQYFRIQPYETVGDGIPEGTWDYRTVPENAVRYVAGPEIRQAFEEIRGGRVILADAEAARLALLDGATGLAALTALVEPALTEMEQATADALGVTGINPAYVSATTADPPAAPNGTRGARRTVAGGLQRLIRTAGAWVPEGTPLLGEGSVAFPYIPNFNIREEVTVDGAGGLQTLTMFTAEGMGLKADDLTDNTAKLQRVYDSREYVVYTGRGGGDYSVDGTVTASGLNGQVYVWQGRARLKQQATRTPLLKLSGTDVQLVNPRMAGLGAGEWNGLSSNLGRLLWITGGSNFNVLGGLLTGAGYAGLFVELVSDLLVDGLRVIGPGDITPGGNYNFGIKLHSNWDEDGRPNATIRHCHVSRTAQGYFTGPGWDFSRLLRNVAEYILGQHGFYLNPGHNMEVDHNRTFQTALNGIKVQSSFANRGSSKRNLRLTNNLAVDAGSWGFVVSQGDTVGDLAPDGNPVPESLFLNPTVANNTASTCVGGLVVEDSRGLTYVENRALDSLGIGHSFRNTTGRGWGNENVNSKTSAIQMLEPVSGGTLELVRWKVAGACLDLSGLSASSDQRSMISIQNTGQTVKLCGDFDIGAGTPDYALYETSPGTLKLSDLTLPGLKVDGTPLLTRMTGTLAEFHNVAGVRWYGIPVYPASGVTGSGYSVVTVPGAVPPTGYYYSGQRFRPSVQLTTGPLETVVSSPGYVGTAWAASTAFTAGTIMTVSTRAYRATMGGTTGTVAPTHTTGSATDGGVTWEYVGSAATTITVPVDALSRAGGIVTGTVQITAGTALLFSDSWAVTTIRDSPVAGENSIFHRNSDTTRDNKDHHIIGPNASANRLKSVKFRSYQLLHDAPDGIWNVAVIRTGTTAQRPTANLYIGLLYRDSTLGKYICVRQVTPSVVWEDMMGTTV
ncbi:MULTISPECIES: right-handed parallel beta-helix repeat-containing protein [Deinococcus]|uniref:Right-handed parallel beta-helix repeat-containing protein n=1 Tax=Deinococcus rufus TaxID=2136097 RepID=A0ABV7ZBP1_9DEIO|nr:right-handed parallel beta-helix repeat-containing protein [Deinococcus sp. AB2017081]WQE94033.1 right-handed parallel beta-helix repeat-containing protein [Deinococcus sp. AB2017081]